ncbi:hypothetical protein GCM10011508_15540 [Flavobacterium lutivivi]|nr:hypothetical protein GCM10011508_15540 [Flavobacterium lutivivi]
MSVEQIDKIDFISENPNGEIELTISDHLEWDEEKTHLLILQDKVNSYLDFIQSDQILETHPSAENKKVVISILMKYEPDNDGLKFLKICEEFLKNQDLKLKWKVLAED